jgi:DNA-binding NtrC family response regulator
MSHPKPKVLFVDDEEAILRSLSWTFDDDPDLEVLTTSDPRRALSLLNTQDISVLVTDERMPDLPGHQLVKHCKTLSPTTLAMVMSGFAESQPMVNALLSGKIHRFLSKPWQPEGIVHIIKQAVKLVQYQQSRRDSLKPTYATPTRTRQQPPHHTSSTPFAPSPNGGLLATVPAPTQ